MGAERDRVAEFGKLENGLRQAGDWYRWGPYIKEYWWYLAPPTALFCENETNVARLYGAGDLVLSVGQQNRA